MAYTKQVWHDTPATDTPVSAARLSYLEAGVEAAAAVADSAQAAAQNALAATRSYVSWLGPGESAGPQLISPGGTAMVDLSTGWAHSYADRYHEDGGPPLAPHEYLSSEGNMGLRLTDAAGRLVHVVVELGLRAVSPSDNGLKVNVYYPAGEYNEAREFDVQGSPGPANHSFLVLLTPGTSEWLNFGAMLHVPSNFSAGVEVVFGRVSLLVL